MAISRAASWARASAVVLARSKLRSMTCLILSMRMSANRLPRWNMSATASAFARFWCVDCLVRSAAARRSSMPDPTPWTAKWAIWPAWRRLSCQHGQRCKNIGGGSYRPWVGRRSNGCRGGGNQPPVDRRRSGLRQHPPTCRLWRAPRGNVGIDRRNRAAGEPVVQQHELGRRRGKSNQTTRSGTWPKQPGGSAMS